jgi:hypothetical protein
MPMAKLLTSRAFDPETTSLLGAAFDKAWQTVQTSEALLPKRNVLPRRVRYWQRRFWQRVIRAREM